MFKETRRERLADRVHLFLKRVPKEFSPSLGGRTTPLQYLLFQTKQSNLRSR
jgi:uncharacterized membrane protein